MTTDASRPTASTSAAKIKRSKYDFTRPWFHRHVPNFDRLLGHFRGAPVRMLEVGSYEGCCTTWLVDELMEHPQATLLCIDPWAEADATTPMSDRTFSRFSRNLALTRFPEKVEVLRTTSTEALPQLVLEQQGTFDFIYIDGSHLARDVLFDAVVAFQLLKTNGILWFDDYGWGKKEEHKAGSVNVPRTAIDAFLKCFAGQYDLLHRDYQLAIRRTSAPAVVGKTPRTPPTRGVTMGAIAAARGLAQVRTARRRFTKLLVAPQAFLRDSRYSSLRWLGTALPARTTSKPTRKSRPKQG